VCTALPPGPYLVSQLDANLNVEWSFQNTTIDSEHPNGFEWCVNAPVIDGKGLVYASSEDGHVYSIPQGHKGIFDAAAKDFPEGSPGRRVHSAFDWRGWKSV